MSEVSVADLLCNASASGNFQKVKDLLDKGADVNGLNAFLRTPLQVVMLGNADLVETLLLAGAHPNVPDWVLNLTVTHDAAREGFVDSVRVLLDHGADPNLVDGEGNLPLHLAAKEGHLQVIQLLIERTANPRTTNDEGKTAAGLALENEKIDTFNYIMQYLNSH
uniref:cyclin-dependent kinase 4 inhibitor C n=1 Tax=Semicossyphus pulcher TaxID=241346 RepID=UPI0037E708C4